MVESVPEVKLAEMMELAPVAPPPCSRSQNRQKGHIIQSVFSALSQGLEDEISKSSIGRCSYLLPMQADGTF